jgi:hypothetical protein
MELPFLLCKVILLRFVSLDLIGRTILFANFYLIYMLAEIDFRPDFEPTLVVRSSCLATLYIRDVFILGDIGMV